MALCICIALFAAGCGGANCRIVFMNEGQTYFTLTCEEGEAISFPSAPTKDADEDYTYEFCGWSTEDIGIVYGDEEITADLYTAGSEFLADGGTTLYSVYRAKAVERSYTVVFRDGITDAVIERQTVPMGGDATPPTPLEHEGYTFDRWEGNYENITQYTQIVARYTVNKYDLVLHYLGEEHTVATEYGKLLEEIEPEISDPELFAGWYTDDA